MLLFRKEVLMSDKKFTLGEAAIILPLAGLFGAFMVGFIFLLQIPVVMFEAYVVQRYIEWYLNPLLYIPQLRLVEIMAILLLTRTVFFNIPTRNTKEDKETPFGEKCGHAFGVYIGRFVAILIAWGAGYVLKFYF